MEQNEIYDSTGKFILINDTLLSITELSLVEMATLTTIESLESDNGGCWASNQYLSKHLHVHENTIVNTINRLEKKGLISRQGKGRNRTLRINKENLLRNVQQAKSNNSTNIVEIENSTNIVEIGANNTNIVEQPHNFCEITTQNLGTISIDDKDNNIDSIKNSHNNNCIYDNNDTVNEPTERNDIWIEWETCLNNAYSKQLPLEMMYYARKNSVRKALSLKLVKQALECLNNDAALALEACTLSMQNETLDETCERKQGRVASTKYIQVVEDMKQKIAIETARKFCETGNIDKGTFLSQLKHKYPTVFSDEIEL